MYIYIQLTHKPYTRACMCKRIHSAYIPTVVSVVEIKYIVTGMDEKRDSVRPSPFMVPVR